MNCTILEIKSHPLRKILTTLFVMLFNTFIQVELRLVVRARFMSSGVKIKTSQNQSDCLTFHPQ